MNKTTRLNIDQRWELIENRCLFLRSEIDKLKTEYERLIEEQNLLNKLREIYNLDKGDPIDVERSIFLTNTSKPSNNTLSVAPRKGSIRATLLALLETGPATCSELATASGLTLKQVSNNLLPFRHNGTVDLVNQKYMLVKGEES